MKINRLVTTLCLNLLCVAPLAHTLGAEEKLPIISAPNLEMPITFEAAEISHDLQIGLSRAEGNVVLANNSQKILADYAEYNAQTGEFSMRGKVRLLHQDGTQAQWTGEELSGNIKTKELHFGIFKVIYGPIHICGEDGHYQDGQGILLPKGSLTTCDCEKPHYIISARKIRYLDDGSIEAWHLVGKVKGIPFFYFPYIYIDSRLLALDIEFRLGYSNRQGFELGVGKRFKISENTSMRAMVDILTRCGPGIELESDTKTKNSETKIKVFARQDALADEDLDENGYYRGFDVDQFRYQLSLFHRYDVEEVEGLSLRAKVDYLSDALYLNEWGKGIQDYDTPQNSSYFELALDTDLFIFSAYARPKLNEFDSVAEKLPEIRVDIPRVSLGETPFQYEGAFQGGAYKMKWREYEDPNYFEFEEYDHTRIDTQHFLYLPLDLFDKKVQFTPRIGFDATIYSNTSSQSIRYQDLNNLFIFDDPAMQFLIGNSPILQYAEDGVEDTHSRIIAEAGFELNTKLTRAWSDVKVYNPFFQLDGLRHVIEPFVNYTVTTKPTLEHEKIFFFDEKDQLEQQHFIQVGVKQRWQTRRLGRLFTFASLDTYANFHFEDEYQVVDRQRHAADLGIRFTYRPLDELLVANENLFDLENGEVLFNRSHLQYQAKSGWSSGATYMFIGDEYLNRPAYSLGTNVLRYGTSTFNIPWGISEEANLGTWFFSMPLGEKTRLTYTIGYDFHDHNVAGHSLVLNRNLHCWDLGTMFRVDSEDRWGIFFVLSLHAFPKISYQFSEEE